MLDIFNGNTFQIILWLSILPFLFKKNFIFGISTFIVFLTSTFSSIWASIVLMNNSRIDFCLGSYFNNNIHITIDALSAFFILVINFTVITGFLYSRGYLASYMRHKNKTETAMHYFAFIWLHLSMLLTVMLRDGFAFLFSWEIMSLSSFFLVIFDSKNRVNLKIGLNYLIQMHIGLVLILSGFLISYHKTGSAFDFESFGLYFNHHNSIPLFLLMFVGFGIKAGFIPLHTWLPYAHPSAPSHVSGIMSGVMIKLGIYGILRVITYLHSDFLQIGIIILSISLVSGILGVSFAIIQHNFKKILAYSSIENIGIIGIGIGLGLIGIGLQSPVIAVFGFAGGILHILNHSLFKSLLFFSTGNVYSSLHSLNIEKMGGLGKKMPITAMMFLIGSLSICGLPPFNGFISEFLIYIGLFKSLHSGGLLMNLLSLIGFIGLAFIGGLAFFCFAKVFSIVFLGNPRSNIDNVSEAPLKMQIPNILILFLILAVGLLPFIFISPLENVVKLYIQDTSALQQSIPLFTDIGITSLILLTLIGVIWFFRLKVMKSKTVNVGPTWGCGYSGANPAKHQYTSSSFADNFTSLSRKTLQIKKDFPPVSKDEIFPYKRTFNVQSSDIFERFLIKKPWLKFLISLKKMAVFQTGNLQHYLLYAIVFIIFISLISFFNLI